ncbi:hypothetical protein PC116_g4534 [Phytophthora cactorum]|nr:hypothetical protein PC116_g4534 [Phytophthora cactorum]
MRHLVVMLALVVFVTSVGVASTAVENKLVTPESAVGSPDILVLARLHTEAQHDAPCVRFLRTHKSTENSEERAAALQLHKSGNALLNNPQLSVWMGYMNLFNKVNPTKKTSMVAALTAHYGDQGLTRIIEAAKKVPTTSTMAKHLQTEQIQRWMADKKTPEALESEQVSAVCLDIFRPF